MAVVQNHISQDDLPAGEPLEAVGPGRKGLRKLLGRLMMPLLILVFGGGAWVYTGGAWTKDVRESLPPEDLSTSGRSVGMMVTAEPVAFRPMQRIVEAVGTLHGFEEIVISAKVEGRVSRIHGEAADRVLPDELLTEIDPTDYRLAAVQAENNLRVELAKLGLQGPPDDSFDLSKVPTVMLAAARLENMQAKMERTRRLAAENAASKGDLENAVSEFRTAQADHANQLLLAKSILATIQLRQSALAIANQQLTDTQIRVPQPRREVPGLDRGVTYVVTKRAVAEGAFVRAGGEVYTLAIDKTLKLRVPVPERFSAQVKLGQKAALFTAAFSEPFSGKVSLVHPAVSPTTRTFEVEIQVANDQGQLKPGGFAKAVIETNQTEHAVTVPLSALVTFAGVTKVFLAEGGKAREVRVTPGVQTREWIEIAEPQLGQGAVVITSGQSRLADETAISIRQTPAVAVSVALAPESGGHVGK